MTKTEEEHINSIIKLCSGTLISTMDNFALKNIETIISDGENKFSLKLKKL